MVDQPIAVTTWREEETGLRLPNGEEIFPPMRWHGYELATPAQREAIRQAIATSSANLGISQEEIAKYRWVRRIRTITAVIEKAHADEHIDLTGYVPPPEAITNGKHHATDLVENLPVGTQPE